jgi:hypothetical protein
VRSLPGPLMLKPEWANTSDALHHTKWQKDKRHGIGKWS